MNALLVYWLVVLTGRASVFLDPSPISSESLPPRFSERTHFIALVSSLLFMCHPIQTEAVTYIVQRFTSLATLFYLLSIVFYARFRLLSYGDQSRVPSDVSCPGATTEHTCGKVFPLRRQLCYAGSIASAVFAMKTKEIAVTLPVMITAYEFIFFKEPSAKRIKYLAPLLATGVIVPVSLLASSNKAGNLIGDVSSVTRVHSDVSRWDYLLTQFTVICKYLRLLFLPVNQNLDYDYPIMHSFFNTDVLLSFLFLSAILALGIYLLSHSRAGGNRISTTNQCYRLISFGIFWLFIGLSVESGLIPIADVIFEHRMYLPSVGVFIAISAAAWLLFRRIKSAGQIMKKAMVVPFIVVVIVLTGLTYHRNTVWQNAISLWSDVVKKSPRKARGYYGLGGAYKEQGDLLSAQRAWVRSLELDSTYPPVLNQLGNVYYLGNDFIKAKEYYEKSLQLNYDNNAEAHYNLALVLERLNQQDKAIEHYEAFLNTFSPVYGSLAPAVQSKVRDLKQHLKRTKYDGPAENE